MPSRPPSAWMWAEACELLDRADRLNRQFFQPARPRTRRPTWEPPVDLFESDREVTILVALPGVSADSVGIAVGEGGLRITGERPIPREAHGAVLHRLEIPHGFFERQVALPGGHFEVARRDMVDGCLHLTLRKLR